VNLNKVSSSSINIREGKKRDIPLILKLWTDTINWHSELDNDFTLAKDGIQNFELVLTNALGNSSQIVIIAEERENIVGFLYGYLKKYTGFFRKRIVAHISDIAVNEEHRRRGIGTALMEKFEQDFAKLNDTNDLSLFVHTKNNTGVEFYNHLGFEVTLLTMQKTIKPKE